MSHWGCLPSLLQGCSKYQSSPQEGESRIRIEEAYNQQLETPPCIASHCPFGLQNTHEEVEKETGAYEQN